VTQALDKKAGHKYTHRSNRNQNHLSARRRKRNQISDDRSSAMAVCFEEEASPEITAAFLKKMREQRKLPHLEAA
jgi:hypothetical protein